MRLLNKVTAVGMASAVISSIAGCGSKTTETTAIPAAETTAAASGETAAALVETKSPNAKAENKDKPLVWSSRQPSSSATGQLNMAALSYNKDIYYVELDINQGAELQDTMVKEYIEKSIDNTGRNGDGIVGYVLAIGDIGHGDSIACTRGIRKAPGTAVEKDGNINGDPIGTNTDGTSAIVQDGKIEVNGKSYIVRELVSQEVKNSVSTIWDTATTGNSTGTWSSSFGDQVDIVALDSDGMGMSMFNVWSKDNKVPTSDYDIDSGAVVTIAGGYGGAISQHADVQVYLTLRVLRNALDGVDVDADIGTADDTGDVLSKDVYVYKADERSYCVLSVAATGENYNDFMDSTMVYAPVSNQLDEGAHLTKDAQPNIYNSVDNFLGSTYQSSLQKYDRFLNLKVEYIGGDDQTESNITNRPGSPSQYGAFAINMVKTDSAASYTNISNQ